MAKISAVGADDSAPAGAPEHEIEITPEIIRRSAGILLCADYRFETEEDVAKEMLEMFLEYLNGIRRRHIGS